MIALVREVAALAAVSTFVAAVGLWLAGMSTLI